MSKQDNIYMKNIMSKEYSTEAIRKPKVARPRSWSMVRYKYVLSSLTRRTRKGTQSRRSRCQRVRQNGEHGSSDARSFRGAILSRPCFTFPRTVGGSPLPVLVLLIRNDAPVFAWCSPYRTRGAIARAGARGESVGRWGVAIAYGRMLIVDFLIAIINSSVLYQ